MRLKFSLLVVLMISTLATAEAYDFRVKNQTGDEVGEVSYIDRGRTVDVWINGTQAEHIQDHVFIHEAEKRGGQGVIDLNMGRFFDVLTTGGYLGKHTTYTEQATHLVGVINMNFDTATVQLQRTGHLKNITYRNFSDNTTYIKEEWFSFPVESIVRCGVWDRLFWKCGDQLEKRPINFLQDDETVKFNVSTFSGWYGLSLFYSNFEGGDTNLCNGGEGYSGSCTGNNKIEGDYNATTYLDVYSARFHKLNTSTTRNYIFVNAGANVYAREHYSRVYLYIPSNYSWAGGRTFLTWSTLAAGTTLSMGFVLETDGRVRCFVDDTNATFDPLYSVRINVTKDAWHYYEYFINSTPAGANDLAACWVDGSLLANVTGRNFDEVYPARIVGLGHVSINSGAVGEWYADEHRITVDPVGGYPVINNTQFNFDTDSDGNTELFESENASLNATFQDLDGDLNTSSITLQWWDPTVIPTVFHNVTMQQITGDNYQGNVSENNYTLIPLAGVGRNFRFFAEDDKGQEFYTQTVSTGFLNTIANATIGGTPNGSVINTTDLNGTGVLLQCEAGDANGTNDIAALHLFNNETGDMAAFGTVTFDPYSTSYELQTSTPNTTESVEMAWRCATELWEFNETGNTSDYVFSPIWTYRVNVTDGYETWKFSILLIASSVTALLGLLAYLLDSEHYPLKLFLVFSTASGALLLIPMAVTMNNTALNITTTYYKIFIYAYVAGAAWITIKAGVHLFESFPKMVQK